MCSPDELASPPWLTPREVAVRWRVSVQTVLRECDAGTLAAMKVGKRWRIHIKTVEERERRSKEPSDSKAATLTVCGLPGRRRRRWAQLPPVPNYFPDLE